jgi:DNA sulfur modification protein DndE
MEPLNIRRVTFSKDIDSMMRWLQGKLGITPNLLCRIGYCMSLEEHTAPEPGLFPPGDRIINRYTLTGAYDDLFVSLLRQRMSEDNMPWSEADQQFMAHMNRGVDLVASRARTLTEILALAPANDQSPTSMDA